MLNRTCPKKWTLCGTLAGALEDYPKFFDDEDASGCEPPPKRSRDESVENSADSPP